MRNEYLALGVTVLLVLSGCAAVSDQTSVPTTRSPSSPSQTGLPTDATGSPPATNTEIVVQGGSIPVDPTVVWQRTQRLLGANVTPPERIVVGHPESRTYSHPPFYRLLTRCSDVTVTSSEGGSVESPDTIYLDIDANTSAPAIEKILVHEYTHVVQYRTGVPSNLSVDVLGPVLQGAAIYTADAYVRTYLEDTPLQSTAATTRYQAAPPCEQALFAQNYFGYRYVAHRVDSPRDLPDVYMNPPRTSEQLLHNLSPGAEPPQQLSVHVDQAAASEWLLAGNRTRGELAVRSVLWTELPPDRARAAAAGWGNDRLLRFSNGTADGVVWVLRWDDTANATAFTDALGTYFDRRAAPTETGWADGTTRFALNRTSADTVVVVAGDGAFVRDVTVTESEEAVTVTTGSHSG